MKKILNAVMLLSIILVSVSCSNRDELKEISGSYEFNITGKHTFSINADFIRATITIKGANGGETLILEDVKLDKDVTYTALVGGFKNGKTFNDLKTLLLSNYAVQYEVLPGTKPDDSNGFIRIDWKGFN